MNTKEFYYDLDPSFIAQHPEQKRENSKLMIVNKENFDLEHKRFYNIIDYLNPGDCLVLNDTRVIPARIYGHRPNKDEEIEVLLLRNTENTTWECLAKPGRKLKIGTEVIFSDELKATVVDIDNEGHRFLRFEFDGVFQEILEKIGSMPIPPYITEKLEDKESYQTVYAKYDGSVAAPTAGLHFTDELLEQIEAKGVEIAYITLHVGYGTFKPVSAENIEDHNMHSEYYVVNETASQKINKCKENGGRIIAVGTTSIRTLESVMTKHNKIKACSDSTNIFIYPGYKFKIVDALITNFHLPESTLIMLVSTLASKEIIMNAYESAKENDYKFFSFGDAMLIK